MPDDKQTLTDWRSAQSRLLQGRVSDPRQDAIGPATAPGWWWEQQAYRQRQTPGLIPPPQDVEALPLGSLSDPVSQAAFLLAPGMLQAGKATLAELGARPPVSPMGVVRGARLSTLSGERGNLGPVPRSEYGEALPRSVVRDGEGKLTKLHHGTDKVYPDFDPAFYGTGEGGDLYGPGIYMTDSAQVAGTRYTEMQTLQEAERQMAAAREDLAGVASQLPWRTDAERRLAHWTSIAEDTRPNIRPVYADLKRPFAIDATYPPRQFTPLLRTAAQDSGYGPIEDLVDAHGDSPMSGQDLYTALTRVLGDKGAVNDLLQRQGYDGITHMGGNTSGPVHRVFIAFSPEHVYPAPNVEALK